MKIYHKTCPDGWQITLPTLTVSYYPGSLWFRIFGKGLSINDRSIHPALFSERNGYIKVYRIGKWAIKVI